MTQENVEEIRIVARRLAERLQEDADFKEQVRENPQLLLDEGLPEMAMADFLNATDLSDVSGYLGCTTISSI
ncbi:hypothetical protein [Tengunoibacter tsumagoiensis]|uniref:Nif11 domain-containing protein n=1 Tax=Tengunoibacter tsumagoiensis TaxID=2014871 RepID=A0A402A164_9CHLR|nr:hypothetical protein [Tengunoibacter tsumagoiensis]GCE12815.1 hypothetical protein KTT_26740 [Tengunoibacter tsumagoiensis]